MYTLKIEGNAFLWHQIRCIMGVLLLIGQGKESPSVIANLLDVDTNPRKPQYNMALDVPLNLFHCSYDIEDNWVYDQDELRSVLVHLQSEWTIHNVKTAMLEDCLANLEGIYYGLSNEKEIKDSLSSESNKDRVMAHSDCLLQGVKSKTYTPLLKRETCSSLEERIDYYKKKRKVTDVE